MLDGTTTPVTGGDIDTLTDALQRLDTTSPGTTFSCAAEVPVWTLRGVTQWGEQVSFGEFCGTQSLWSGVGEQTREVLDRLLGYHPG